MRLVRRLIIFEPKFPSLSIRRSRQHVGITQRGNKLTRIRSIHSAANELRLPFDYLIDVEIHFVYLVS